MAPSPEYDKEPKGPDKTSAGGDSSVQRRTPRLPLAATNATSANPQENNEHDTHDDGQVGALYDDVTPNKTPNREAKTSLKDNDVEALDDGQLRALLDEAIQYKCPKDREGKSNLFKELLEEVEQDEQACEAANVRGWAAGGSGRSRRRGRRVLPHSNSLQDLVDALAEPALRRRAPPVSSRTHHGGSLPSGVDTSFLLGEEPVRGTEYVATVRCVNPSPLNERRVSASDAHNGTELVNITRWYDQCDAKVACLYQRLPFSTAPQSQRRSGGKVTEKRSKMPVFPVTYTARATLEIGSGSVCTGRAVTTTTASNQVRTRTLSRTRNTLSYASPRDSQTLLMSALKPRVTDGGGRIEGERAPRGPPGTSTYKHRDTKGPRQRDSLKRESPPVFMPPEVRPICTPRDSYPSKKFQLSSSNWAINKQFRTNRRRSPISTARYSKPYSNKRFDKNAHPTNDMPMEVDNYDDYKFRNYSSSVDREFPVPGPPEHRHKQSTYNYNVQRHKSLQQDLNVFVENRKYLIEKKCLESNRGKEPKNQNTSPKNNVWLKAEKRQKAGFVVKTKPIINYREDDDEVPFVQCSLAHHVRQSSFKKCIESVCLGTKKISVESNSEPVTYTKCESVVNKYILRDNSKYEAVLRKKYPLYMGETSLETTTSTGCESNSTRDTLSKYIDDTLVNNFSNIVECDNTILSGLTCYKDDKKNSEENSYEFTKSFIGKCDSPHDILNSEENNNQKSCNMQIEHVDLNGNNNKMSVTEEENCETEVIHESENNKKQIIFYREVNIDDEVKKYEGKNKIKRGDENLIDGAKENNMQQIIFDCEIEVNEDVNNELVKYDVTEANIDKEVKKSISKNKIRHCDENIIEKYNKQQIIFDSKIELSEDDNNVLDKCDVTEVDIENENKKFEDKMKRSDENIIEDGAKEKNKQQIMFDNKIKVSEDDNNDLVKSHVIKVDIDNEIKISEKQNKIKRGDETIEKGAKENKIIFDSKIEVSEDDNSDLVKCDVIEVDIDNEIKKSENKTKIKQGGENIIEVGVNENNKQKKIFDSKIEVSEDDNNDLVKYDVTEVDIDNEIKKSEDKTKIKRCDENIIEEDTKNIPEKQGVETTATEDDRDLTVKDNVNLVNKVDKDLTLLSGDQLIFAELTDTAYVFLKMPKSLFVLPESVAINNNYDNLSLSLVPSNTNKYNKITFSDIIDEFDDNVIKYQKKEGCDNEQQNTLINNNKSKQILRRVAKKSAKPTKEVDSNVPFSCITTPEVVTSCNTTNSTSPSAIVVDPKPLQLESSYAAVSSLTGGTPNALHRLSSALQSQSSVSSGFSGMPLTRYNAAGATVVDDKFQKSFDENGNTMQNYTAPPSNSSQIKKNRKKKSSKNETVINIDQMAGYQGNKDVDELMRFIESDAETARGKLARKHDDKKRSSERHARDKEVKLPRATSMEELRRGNEHRKTERRSWGDRSDRYLEPEPHSDLELLDFQTVTKKKRPRRPPAEPPRRAPAAPDRRRKSAPPSDNNDSNDDLDSIHSLPEPAAAPRTAVSYADIARASHAIPDLIESCNFYTDSAAGGAVAPQKSVVADSYPALETKTPPKKSKESTRPSPPTKKSERSDVDRPAPTSRPNPTPPDVVSDRRPPVILLDEARRPRDMDGVTFGFDINEQLLGGCDLVRGGCLVRAGGGTALTYLPPADTHRALQEQLRHIVDYVGSAWDDIMQCGNGKVRYFSE